MNCFTGINRSIASLTLLIATIFYSGCTNGQKQSSLPGYDLSKPDKFAMPESLLEISGICFYNGNADTVYAIQDEDGKLFRLAWGVKQQYHAKFGRSGDYEDVAIVNNNAVILKSNGVLYSFPMEDAVYAEVDDVKEWKDILPKGEYESLYGDSNGNLYALCKNCAIDNKKDEITGYVINLNSQASISSTFKIDVNAIAKFTGKVKRGFRPSGMSLNPVTKDWFIISAVNKLLVVADQQWKIKGAYQLDGNRFNQPEGIAFDKTGNLYISNEGDDLTDGNILKFERLK